MIKSFGLRQELRVLRAQERCRNLVHFPRAFPKDSNWSSEKRPSLLLHLVMVPFKLWHTLFKAAMFFAALFTSFLQELANSRASRRAFRAAVAASLSVLLLLALAGLSLFCPSSSLGTDQTSSSTWIVASSLLGPLGAAAGLALALPTVFFLFQLVLLVRDLLLHGPTDIFLVNGEQRSCEDLTKHLPAIRAKSTSKKYVYIFIGFLILYYMYCILFVTLYILGVLSILWSIYINLKKIYIYIDI